MIELLIAMATMIIVTGAAFALIQGSLKFTTATFHMTDAEQSMRTAHELINRDLTTAGDGLKGIGQIPIPPTFSTNYLTQTPVLCPNPNSAYVCMAIVTSDDNIAGTTAVLQTSPAVNVLASTDRLTVLAQDSNFSPAVSLLAGKITFSGTNTNIAVTATDINRFHVGEIYAIVAQNSAAFGVISSINTGTNTLTLTNGDAYGINQTGVGTPIATVTQAGTIPSSIVRIQIIHYFLNSNKLLIRRVFGVTNAGFIDSVIAEHVTNLQFRYLTNTVDANGFVPQPTRALTTSTQQAAVREVETTIGVETVKALNTTNNSNNVNAGRQTINTTTMSSVRNLQFRKALL